MEVIRDKDLAEGQVTHENIQTLPVNSIFLDGRNPRLPTSLKRDQKNMALYIARNTSITELMTAIAENGYFPGEPVVVIPRSAGGYTVVEGNRRVTALKLLNDPTLYPKNKRVRQISDHARHRPDAIPCVVFGERSEIVHYLGYRHISGVKQWEPLAKARYIAYYFEEFTDSSLDPEDRYRGVARGIGSRGPYIKRQLDGLAVYRHIENKDFYEIDGLDEESISFSLLSTAVGYETILDYSSSTKHPFIDPAGLNADSVRNLTTWMFEPNDQGETTLGDSRNIQRLALIVADKRATYVLLDSRNFQKAYAITKGVEEEFSELLTDIEWGLGEAVSNIALVDLDDGHRSKISNIYKQARFLRRGSEED